MKRMHRGTSYRFYYHACRLILLFVTLLSRDVIVLSKPAEDQSNCSMDTETLYSNSFVIAETATELEAYADIQRSTPDAICTRQSKAKTTCKIDFANVTESSDWCLGVPDTLYVVTDFIYKCTFGDYMMFYNVRNRPACYAAFTKPISSCYNGYDNTIIEGIERATFNDLIGEFTSSTATDKEWGEITYTECEEIRLAVSEPIFGGSSLGEGGDETDSNAAGSDSTASCSSASAETQSSPEIVDAIAVVETQLGIQDRSTTLPTEDVDYGKVSHNISAICRENLNGIYLEVSYSVSCSDGSVSFEVLDDPVCVSKMYCGRNNFEAESIAFVSAKWENSTTCQISVAPIWEDFSPSAGPTSTNVPTDSPAPSSRPTVTPEPTVSSAPTQSPTALDCKSDSLRLVLGEEPVNPEENRIIDEIKNLDNLMMIDKSEGYSENCNPLEDGTNLCEFNYDGVTLEASMNDADENSLVSICRDANKVYVEDSVSIICTSSNSASPSTTNIIIKNKPSCRSKNCNADGVEEVATFEFERWMKLNLQQGLVGATQGNETSSSPILLGPQSCVIDEEEGVSVSVAGSTGGSTDGSIEPSEECVAASDGISGIIDVYNERILIQRTFAEYIDTDLRQVCGSPKPNVLECNFDWNELFPASGSTMKSTCMPDKYSPIITATGRSGGSSRGQYVEATVRISCTNEQGELTMTNTNVPGCVGIPCPPGQSQSILGDNYGFLTQKLVEKEGYSCTTQVLSVYAANYDPNYQLFFDESDQADEMVAATMAPSKAPVGNLPPSGTYILNIPTSSPTASPQVIDGTRFGLIYTEVPTSESRGGRDPNSSSAPKTIGVTTAAVWTTTVLILHEVLRTML